MRIPLWKHVTSELERELVSGRYPVGGRFHSLKELSERYGISGITGRRVLDELRAKKLIDSFRGKGTFVRRGAVAGAVKVLLHPVLAQSGYSHQYVVQEVLQGAQAAARESGCAMRLVSTDHFASHVQPDDLVLTLWHSRHAEAVGIAVARGARVVCAHAPEPVAGASTVGPDFAAGIALAVRHLLERGHRRIAYLTGPTSSVWFAARFDGYYRTLRKAGIACDLALVREGSAEDGGDVQPMLDGLLKLTDPPTAVICANDGRALAVLGACRERGIRVPADLAVVGFDNTHDGALVAPALTSVDQFWQRQGAEAVALLLRQAEAPMRGVEDLVIAPALVVRASS